MSGSKQREREREKRERETAMVEKKKNKIHYFSNLSFTLQSLFRALVASFLSLSLSPSLSLSARSTRKESYDMSAAVRERGLLSLREQGQREEKKRASSVGGLDRSTDRTKSSTPIIPPLASRRPPLFSLCASYQM